MIRKIFVSVALLAACSLAHAQISIKDVLNSSKVRDVVSSVTGVDLDQYINTNIQDTWNYLGMASEVSKETGNETTNILTGMAGSAAMTTVNNKLDKALAKAGIKEGSMTFVFNADNTFTHRIGKKTVSGTYTIEGKVLTLTYGKTFKLPEVKGSVDLEKDNLKILFEADKFLTVIGKVTSKVKYFSSVNTAIQQIDGMKLGVSLLRDGAEKPASLLN